MHHHIVRPISGRARERPFQNIGRAYQLPHPQLRARLNGFGMDRNVECIPRRIHTITDVIAIAPPHYRDGCGFTVELIPEPAVQCIIRILMILRIAHVIAPALDATAVKP